MYVKKLELDLVYSGCLINVGISVLAQMRRAWSGAVFLKVLGLSTS